MSAKKILTISKRTMNLMRLELSLFSDVETGGILLGYSNSTDISVYEATDGGYKNVIHEAGKFEYDAEYVEHISNHISMLYQPQLELIGIWHKHNHANDPALSHADRKLGRQIRQLLGKDAISILFQKQDCDTYKMRIFVVNSSLRHREINTANVIIEE